MLLAPHAEAMRTIKRKQLRTTSSVAYALWGLQSYGSSGKPFRSQARWPSAAKSSYTAQGRAPGTGGSGP